MKPIPWSVPRIATSPATLARKVTGVPLTVFTLYVPVNWRSPFVYDSTCVSSSCGLPSTSGRVQVVVIVAGLPGASVGGVVGVPSGRPRNLPQYCVLPEVSAGFTTRPKPLFATWLGIDSNVVGSFEVWGYHSLAG